MMKNFVALGAVLALVGCNTIENQYVSATGRYGSGQTTFGAMQENVKFSIGDGRVTCRGTAPDWRKATVVIPVACTDGKSGTVTMTRPMTNASMVAGEGTMQLTNGETRRFIFGRKDQL
ncbi:hypothetical protein [Shinella zoogloeoides]|uniref:hypothetical protein n=1 Tax=Shinella zoogloeoides TaxID=352475 RepID=UPI00299E31F3|nr:hypothetical protein [Shinella zoogloeoides]WPE22507.1 hypothetical protein ShzoTeo12_37230 [Shinella zoogloeoides]